MDTTRCAAFFPAISTDIDTFHFERFLAGSGYGCVAGVDEAGRGPLAGPVVAGCVVLPFDCAYHRFKDSKKLTAIARQELFAELHDCGAGIGFAVVSHQEIDQLNILRASLMAMARAVAQLAGKLAAGPDYLLVDGTFTAPVSLPQKTLIKGESKSASIAAASIIAKVVRDRLMEEYHAQFPEYNFQQNKGYATAAHRRAIERFGPCAIHRRTFRGVREFVDDASENPMPRQQWLW
jgi:ribonuclease HII